MSDKIILPFGEGMKTRSAVSNPYKLTVNQNYSVSANIKQDIPDYHLFIRANIIKWDRFNGNNAPNTLFYGYIPPQWDDGEYWVPRSETVEIKQNYSDTVQLNYLYSVRGENTNPNPDTLGIVGQLNHGRRTKLVDVDIIVDNGDRASLTLEYDLDVYQGYNYHGTPSLIFFNNVGQYANFYIRFRDDSGFAGAHV